MYKTILIKITLILWIFTTSINTYAQLPDFVPLIKKYSPAVVNISTSRTTSYMSNSPRFKQFDNQTKPFEDLPDLFKHFFERNYQNQDFQQQKPSRISSLGSGMIISKDGYILTNYHVINGADKIIVRLKGRREYKAKVIGSDRHTDVALIKIEANNLPIITVGDSNKLKVGEWVFAIGSPFGFDLSASAGIVSAIGRNVPGESEYNYVPFIQTDVAINPGNSGGPLFNLKGEVVGVNSMIYTRSGGYMGISFSIPINMAMNIVHQLKTKGSVTRGWLGVTIQPVTSDLAKSFNMSSPEGSLIAEITKNSPAYKSNLKIGDIILKFNGQKINNNSDLPPLVATTKIGQSVPIVVLRHGKQKTIFVRIQALSESKIINNRKNNNSKYQASGLNLSNVPRRMRKKMNLTSGGALVNSVKLNSSADNSGIIAGDIIMQLNYVEIKNAKHLQKLINKLPKKKMVPILIRRNGNSIYLSFSK